MIPPEIPDSVRYCTAMFLNCTSLTSKVIPPDDAKSEDMFKGCVSIGKIRIDEKKEDKTIVLDDKVVKESVKDMNKQLGD